MTNLTSNFCRFNYTNMTDPLMYEDLIGAIVDHDFQEVLYLLDEGVNPNRVSGLTALSVALMYKENYEIIKLLINRGANIYERGLLIRAVCFANTKVVELLLDYGVDVNFNTNDKVCNTALIAAIHNAKDLNLTKILLDAGADVNIGDCCGNLPIHIALKYSPLPTPLLIEQIGLLLESGTNVNAKDCDGKTPLHLAVHNGYTWGGDFAIIQFIVDKGGDVLAQDNHGMTPIEWVDGGREGYKTRKLLREAIRKLDPEKYEVKV